MQIAEQNDAALNAPEWTISELSAALKRTVEENFSYVRVRGEISGYRGPHSSGHCYFALKDKGARIDAVIWKGTFGRMKFKPEEGMEVVATGRLTTYPGRSTYQIVIDTIAPAGVGALMALLEQRKQKFAAEGLFDEARKQLLPYLPEVIGVVTSPTGAVIRDILHRLSDRFPRRVLIWPVRVQGEGAAEEIAAAIRGFNALPETGALRRPDLLIVARGGGSIEDLWSFNEEIVVRAAADSMIPLISAVGHETDVTLIDFAADRRAPTPTAAAEMAVPVRSELLGEIVSLTQRASACWRRGQEARRTELRAAMRALPTLDGLLQQPRQRLDGCADRLPRALRANAQVHRTQFSRIAAPLTIRLLRNEVERRRERFQSLTVRFASGVRSNIDARRIAIAQSRERVDALFVRAGRAIDAVLDRRALRLERADGLLTALSYQGVLARGFALVRDAAGVPVRSAATVASGSALDIEFTDGRVAAVAGTTAIKSVRVPVRRRRTKPVDEQGNLF
ncbi:MAG: exodeoxyribonuclease VII large subunit [Xanthobacteraceae bacterium]